MSISDARLTGHCDSVQFCVSSAKALVRTGRYATITPYKCSHKHKRISIYILCIQYLNTIDYIINIYIIVLRYSRKGCIYWEEDSTWLD